MDELEKHIHNILQIDNWKKLKIEGFYKSYSPVDTFIKEYENQYLHYTSYLKLYSAVLNLEFIKKNKNLSPELFCSISNVFQDLISICDLLAKQIYITYFDESVLKENYKPRRLYLHTLRELENKAKNLDTPVRRKYNKLYIRKIKKITNPNQNSWYNELKYYRNNSMHGILRLMGRNNNGEFTLLRRGKFEKEFEFIIKNIPVHNKKPTKKVISKLVAMQRSESIVIQCQKYYDEVAALSNTIWGEILDFYLVSEAKENVKLPFASKKF